MKRYAVAPGPARSAPPGASSDQARLPQRADGRDRGNQAPPQGMTVSGSQHFATRVLYGPRQR